MKENLKKQVLQSLRDEEQNRNDDIALMIYIWKRFYGVEGETLELKKLYTLPTQENIKRMRAKIQNEEKKYLPTNRNVAMTRKWNENEWRRLLGYPAATPATHQVKVAETNNDSAQDINTLFDLPPERRIDWG